MKRAYILFAIALITMFSASAFAQTAVMGYDITNQLMNVVITGDTPFQTSVTWSQEDAGGYLGNPQVDAMDETYMAYTASVSLSPVDVLRDLDVPLGNRNIITAHVSIFDMSHNLLQTFDSRDTLLSGVDRVEQPAYLYTDPCQSIFPDTIRISTAFCAYICHGSYSIPVWCESPLYNPSLLEVTITNGCLSTQTHCNNSTCAQLDWTQFRYYKRVYEGCRLYLAMTYCAGMNPGCACIWRSDFYLPVQMAGFSALPGNNSVALNWATVTETNTINFIVSRSESRDGVYAEVYRTEAAGTTSEPRSYAWTDHTVQNGRTYFYKLHVIDDMGNHVYNRDGAAVIASATPRVDAGVATEFGITNYPNPFNSTTTFTFSIPAADRVSLKVFDLLGREVATVVDQYMTSNTYTMRWTADGLPTGVYMYKLTSGAYSHTGKLLYLK